MATTVDEIYEQAMKTLTASDRLRLATMILNGIPPQSVGEYRDDWTDEDMRDVSRYSLQRASTSFGEDEEDA
jgi:hypothetical protein